MRRTGATGGDQQLFEKIKVFFKNQKHEPNIVEITHMCIMHGVHISNIEHNLLHEGRQNLARKTFCVPFERYPLLTK
jgi:UDP-N-acetylglucosamine enolpyruvyl transferase